MASTSRNNKSDNKVPFAGGRYLLSHRLGNGSFGDIFEGYDITRECRVAVKLEKKKVRYPQLEYESKVYRVLHQPPVGVNELMPFASALLRAATVNEGDILNNGTDRGNSGADGANGEKEVNEAVVPPFMVVGIPQIFYYDSEGDYNIMVMELCGPSLEDVFNYCHRRFSLKTVLMIAEQILHRIQYIHEKGFVHRDIKPENFTFGAGQTAHILYVIDFGLSKLYWDCRKNTHIPFVDGKPLTGTARYCSANTHRGFEQSRRDDLESIGFLFVYFLKGSLPWQGIQAKDQQLKTIRIGEKKIATSLEDLCKGLPSEFLKYCQYCRELSYQQKPDYDYLRNLFRAVAQRYGYLCKPVPQADSGTGTGTLNGATLSTNAKDSASYPDSHGITLSTSTGPSRRYGTSMTPTTAAAMVGEKEPDPFKGYYDWKFDWFLKREGEVATGLQQQEAQREAAAAAATPSVNPAYPSQSIMQRGASSPKTGRGTVPLPASSSTVTGTSASTTSSSAADTSRNQGAFNVSPANSPNGRLDVNKTIQRGKPAAANAKSKEGAGGHPNVLSRGAEL